MWTFQNHQTKRTLRESNSQLELLVSERTEALRILSQRLLRIQDEERRRVARDLHDSTGQILAALKISVAILQKRVKDDRRTCEELSGIASLADQALQEIRTTSFLLHPPLLDEVGFPSAAEWYVEGFAQRSGLKVRLDSTPETGITGCRRDCAVPGAAGEFNQCASSLRSIGGRHLLSSRTRSCGPSSEGLWARHSHGINQPFG